MNPETNKFESLSESEDPKTVRLAVTYRDNEGNKLGVNDLCPCGSGKKFKKCCRIKEIERHESANK
jgi:uncharacterized protein YecA (UPF0149 family)